MPPRLTAEQLAALQPGDRVSRIVSPGVWETAPVLRVTTHQISVTWSDGTTARYWRDSGQCVGVPGEQLREAEPDRRMSPERWREVLHVHLTDEMARHHFSAVERDVLAAAMVDDGSATYHLLHDCVRARLDPMDTATLLVQQVLYLRLADVIEPPLVAEFPDPFVAPLATVPEWAQEVVGG